MQQDALTRKMERMQLSQQQQKLKQKKKRAVTYAAQRIIGQGSFGVVYQAMVMETKETVAIKKVLQDRRFKNRELQIMQKLKHPDVVDLKHCFYSKGDKRDEVFLNLVMEYIPETLHRTIRDHAKVDQKVDHFYIKMYMYQLCRSIAYIHSLGVCHRDIKPQNVLLNKATRKISLCDFGSAKILVEGQPNVAYICSRYYRAPELVFEATQYTTAIDIWSLGCVFGEMMLGTPLFAGESGVDHLIEIIKILGTPTKEDVKAMNPNHGSFKFPQIKAHTWGSIFGNAGEQAVDLLGKMLTYDPKTRAKAFESLAHPYFDELRAPNLTLPNGKAPPKMFNFTDKELTQMQDEGLTDKLVPPHLRQQILGL